MAVLVSERHAQAGPVVHHVPGLNCASPLTRLAAMTRPAVVRVMTGPCPDSYVVGIQVWVDDEGRITAVNWVL